MKTTKLIDTCIELLKQMCSDANNELTSGQRDELMAGIHELKRLRRAMKLTHHEVYVVVERIAKAAYEVVESGVSA